MLPPLAVLVFIGIGRHPLIGMFAGYAGVAAGFSANIIVSMIDVLLAGFTGQSAQMVDPNYVVNPAMNMYFLAVSAVVLTILGSIVTEKYVAPRFGKYEGLAEDTSTSKEVTPLQAKGLKYALYSLLLVVIIIVGLSIGNDAFLRDSETGSLLSNSSTLMKGIVPIITAVFLVPGFVYGKVTKSIKMIKT